MGDRCTWTTSTTWFVTCELRLRCVGAGARGAPAHAPATWNDGVDGALLCHLLCHEQTMYGTNRTDYLRTPAALPQNGPVCTGF